MCQLCQLFGNFNCLCDFFLKNFIKYISKIYKQKSTAFGREKRDASQYTVEVVVALDQETMDYYGADLTDVIMTALNLTSQVYEKSNLKQSISVSLLNMFQLPLGPSDFEDAPGVEGGKDAQKMLTKFCEFMGTTDLKYDAAIYWTR